MIYYGVECQTDINFKIKPVTLKNFHAVIDNLKSDLQAP